MTYHMQATIPALRQMAKEGHVYLERNGKPVSVRVALKDLAERETEGYHLYPCACNPKPPGRCPGFKRV